jgi:pSer/pThr/pTyr-binding forkhead associated (FHA) protein
MADGVTNYYALIGVEPAASTEEIRRSYGERVREAMESHDRARFALLQEAFDVLKDFEKRAKYDVELKASIPNTAPQAPPRPPVMPTIGMPSIGTQSGTTTPPGVTGQPQPTGATMGGYAPMGTMTDSTVQMGGTTGFTSAPQGSFPLPTVCPMEVSPCPLLNGTAQPDEGFCPECGFQLGSTLGQEAQMRPLPKLVDVTGREFPLKRGENLVGRAGEVDVLIPHQTVSKRHARLIVEEKGITLEDLQSTNGTKISGVNIPANLRTGVADRTPLQFGAVKLTLIVPEPEVGEMAALPSPDASGDGTVAALTAPEGSNSAARLVAPSGEVHVLTAARTTFGRRQGNTVILTEDSYISGSHAEIVFRDDRFYLTDLGSTNGTRLNGQRIEANQPYPMADGDAVAFGQTTFTYRGPSAK